jgi:uncharacterized protein YkwD
VQNRESVLVGVLGMSRRRLLALVAAVPAAVGLALVDDRDSRAKKGHKQHKKHKKHGKKGKGGHGGGSSGGGYAPDSEERAMLDLINDYRRRNGAAALTLNDQLGAAAEHHSQDMAKKNYFSHKLSNGISPGENILRHGYHYHVYGENIAAGQDTANQTFQQWEGSSEHAKNMRDTDFQEIGIGRAYAQKSKYKWYWTTTFGSK